MKNDSIESECGTMNNLPIPVSMPAALWTDVRIKDWNGGDDRG